MDSATVTRAVVALTLQALSDEECAALRLLIEYPNAKARCAQRAWWPHVEALWCGGDQLPPDIAEALYAVVRWRLTKDAPDTTVG